MAKAVISSVLESLLGKYVDGLGSDSLQVGLWSGELTLQHLTLKPHALAELQLPITVVKGSIQRIHVVVPWNSLGSASVQISIEGVYALVTPNTKLPSPEELRQAKRSQVERQELLRQHDRLAQANNQEGEDESTFLSRLMMRIVDNLQITLRDIHFRYEDKLSNPERPFACGVMIQSFTFHTTDAEGNDVFVDRTTRKERFLHKAATLAWLGVYWDRVTPGEVAQGMLLQDRPSIEKNMGEMVHAMCQQSKKDQSTTQTLQRGGSDARLWIVRPCNVSVRVTKNETTDFSRAAKYTVHSELNGLSCALSREQYEDMLFLNRAFASRQAIEAHFMSARCRPFHSATTRPRDWWDYAVRLVLAKRVVMPGQLAPARKSVKSVRMRFKSVKKASEERRKYMDLFRMQLRKGSPLDASTKESKALAQYEKVYPVDVIMAVRDAAEDAEVKAKRERAEADKVAAASAPASQAAGGGGSWYGYFFGAQPAQASGSTSTLSTPKSGPLEGVLTAEGRASLKKAYDEAVEHEKSHEVPASCNMFSFKIHLRQGQLALYHTNQTTPFLVGSLDASLSVDVRPTNDWEARCRVQHFEVLNGLAENTPFHSFCTLGTDGSRGSTKADKTSPCASLDVAFATNDKQASQGDDGVVKTTSIRVRFTMKPVRLMVDPAFVVFLQRFFVSMLPANQLDKVWSFATSSVSEWIFSDEDEDELYRQTVGRKAHMEFDVSVDFMAPVVVLSETISDPYSPTVIMDFGRFQFRNEERPALEATDPESERLYWSTDMSKVNVRLGRLDSLPLWGVAATEPIAGYDPVVEEFSVKFAVDSSVASTARGPRGQSTAAGTPLTPNISARATLPRVVMKVSQAQITSLGRIHSSLQAQMFASDPALDAELRRTDDASTVSTSTEENEPVKPVEPIRRASKKVFKDKYVMQLALDIGEAVLHLKENPAKDAFRIRVAGVSFALAAFASQTAVQARLRALVMEDCLYNAESKFFHLLSTGTVGENSEEDLISLDSTMFAADAEALNADREADTVVDLRCSVLHVQWNPSSIALLYQILSAYTTALQSHVMEADHFSEDQYQTNVSESAVVEPWSGKPPMLLRASLVQLSVTFNKDQSNRQLVRLAIEDAALEYVTKPSIEVGAAKRHEVIGHLGNFVATDLSLQKHPLYTPLVGLDSKTTTGSFRKTSSTLEPLLAFGYTWSDLASEQSVIKVHFEPVRLVYYHQQLMELVDYLFEGILGAMVAQTIATATRLLLTEEEASTKFEVTARRPTLILPIGLRSGAHWRLTTDELSLRHFPNSIVHYQGEAVDLSKRRRTVSLYEVNTGDGLATVVVETSHQHLSVRADCKRVSMENVNIYCATEAGEYHSVLRASTNLQVEVDDLVSAGSFSAACRLLPRFTLRFRMDDVAFALDRWQYLAAFALIQENFGADTLLAASATAATTSGAAGYRPTMVYSYSRTDLEAVTMQLVFEMVAVRCDLFEDQTTSAATGDVTRLLDQVMAGQSKSAGSTRGRRIATITGSRLAASINQLQDQWPSINVRVESFSLMDQATSRPGAEDPDVSSGAMLNCEHAFEVDYAWNSETQECKIGVEADRLHSVVVPESVMRLLDFVAPASSPMSAPPPPTLARRTSISAVILNDPNSGSVASDAYDMVVSLRGKNMSIAFPQDVYDADSEQVVMRADFDISYTWKPTGRQRNSPESTDADLDIQSSLVVNATGIELFSRNAKRQGCATFASSTATGSSPLVQFIEPCDVHVEVSDLFPHAGQKQQIVALKFSPIEVFASYEDSRVVMEAVDSSTRSYQRHAELTRRPSLRDQDIQQSSTPILSAPGAGSETFEVHRYFTCELGAMSLTLINDCDGCDMGLLQLQTQRCNLFLNVTFTPPLSSSSAASVSAPTTTLSGGGSIVTLISYYNPDTRDWHPMCSEWGLDVSVQGSIYDKVGQSVSPDNELHVIITANHPLDLAVTHGLLEVIASAGGAWNRRSTQPLSPSSAEKQRKTKAPCVIRNDTGLPLTFWMSSGSSDGGEAAAASPTALSIVASGNAADLQYVHSTGRGCGIARKYASRDRIRRDGMRLHLHLADAPFRPIHDIEFEQLGSRAFPLLDTGSGAMTKFTLNFHAQLVDGRIVLTVSSQVKVVSTLSMPIQLLVNDPTWASPVEIGVLYPLRESAVPVMASLGTELRVRPLADAVYNWSAPIPIQTRSEVDLRVESTSGEATRSAIFCVSMVLEQSLRVVSFGEPIVLVNKLPVDLGFRVKSPLGGSGGGSSASSRERIAVGGKSGIWWSDHRHRPQFELSVNGCQTSRWIELTQSANLTSKSGSSTGDVVSVMLLRQDGRPFKLLIQIVEQPPAKALHIFFYAEVWFINRTGLDLVYGNESEAESYLPPAGARTLVGNAQISAYSSSSESPTAGAPTVRLSMPSCGWSSRFTADPRRLSWQDECLTLKADDRRSGHGVSMLYEFGISADYSTRHFGSITTLISVIPRYLVMNKSSHTVLLLEDSSSNAKGGVLFSGTGEAHHILAKGDVYALYWVKGARAKVRTSVLGEYTEFGWSESASFDQVKSRTVVIPAANSRHGGDSIRLQLSVKQGSISQASMVIVISDAMEDDSTSSALAASGEASSWDLFTVHTQLAGLIVTVADKPATSFSEDQSTNLFGGNAEVVNENVARLTVTRVTAELSASRHETTAKLNVMGVKVEDLLKKSKNPVVLRPVTRGDSFSSSRRDGTSGEKCFLTITYLEKPHAKYRWVERLHIEVQDVRVATSMQFVDRLNKLTTETLAHFDSHAYATTLSVFDDGDGDIRGENILEYFVTTEDDASMASITGQKVYIESCEIAPVRVVVSFSREKGDTKNDINAGFWLSNLKFKIDNAYVTLDAFKLAHAMATQEALVESLTAFYVKSVKSQALGLIESVQVTTLVTSAVTSGVSSLVSTIMGKTDPSLANASHNFRYQFLTNNQLVTKHSKLLAECQSTAQFLQQVKHLVYDWDSNHTGLEARGCVALGILNNSRHSLVVNAHLNDGAEMRVLPVGRKHLASAMSSSSNGDSHTWRSDRSMVLFAWGYTPTLLTSGDVYFTVQSNACNVFVTRKTARLKANVGYTATFTHQEVQSWWSTNVVIVGDDLHGHVSSTSTSTPSTSSSSTTGAAGLFGDYPTPSAAATLPPVPLQPSENGGLLDDEYEVVFSTQSLGLIAKQSGPRNVIVRECLTQSDGSPSPALACGRIANGDTILTVNGVNVTNTTQFRDLVGNSPRPVVLRFRRTGERFNANAAYDLFGEKQPSRRPSSTQQGSSGAKADDDDDGFDLFGTGQ